MRIADDLRNEIREMGRGAQLPSSRELVNRYRASPVTVQKSLRRLVTEGLIESRPGVGMFVRGVSVPKPADYGWQTAALRPPPSRALRAASAMRVYPNDVIALHAGYPEGDLLPTRLLRAALGRAIRGDSAIARPPSSGLPELQSWFSQQIATQMAAGLTPPAPSDVIIVPGSQSALSSIFRALVGAGNSLIVESPTYWGAIRAANHAGVRMVPIPSGGAGPDPGEIDRAFKETGARLFYAQPHFANPSGARWSAQLARDVLEIVQARSAFLLEDDWARDFAIGEPPTPLATLDDAGHVVYLRSLSKSIATTIRVAALIARGPARERIVADITTEAMYVSGLLQTAALDVVTQPGWNTHRRFVSNQLRERRDLLVDSLQTHAPNLHIECIPEGGLNLWARLPDSTDLEQLASDCERAGLLIAPGTDWFPAEPAGPYARLSYAAAQPSRFPEAARILSQLVR